ncbi:MAG TPA: methyltransferase [Acidimicrobiales bacterium]|nr:methyltransferase [Acidimicrobiales bacterium]
MDPSSAARSLSEPPPHALLWDMATQGLVARCLHVVAAIGVADAVDSHGAELGDLAAKLDVDADALGRVLRALAGHGVFEVDLPAVRHTEASLLLRSDHPMSMRAFAQMMGLPLAWESAGSLRTTVETGRAGILQLDPGGLFSYLREHEDQAEIFDRAMTSKSHADIGCVLDAYDFGSKRHVVDVGGGRGHLLDAIGARHPGIELTLFEQPEVIARVAEAGAGTKVLVAGDFFTDDLPAADAYLLVDIIHDWEDVDAIRILSNIRRSMRDEAVVVVVESILRDGAGPDPAKTLDIVMLVVTGGRERTSAQFASLFEAAGFEMSRVVPTAGGVSLVEARPAR